MAHDARYLFIASMDVDADKEDLFNEVYDTEHVPNLLKVPGCLSVTRYRKQPLVLGIGGERKQIDTESEPTFVAVYEVESPDVLVSDAWVAAVEAGRWPTEVRPHTKNRHHVLHEIMAPEESS